MISIAVQFFRQGGVDLHAETAILFEGRFAFGHQFRRVAVPANPWIARDAEAPVLRARIPIIVTRAPPIAAAEEPVPASHGKPAFRGLAASHFVFHLPLFNRSAEIVIGLHVHFKSIAKCHRFFRCLDLHFELGFLVFFDAELVLSEIHVIAQGAVPDKLDAVLAECGFIAKCDRVIDCAGVIGLECFLQHLLAMRIVDRDLDGTAGELVCIQLRIITDDARPGFPLHFLAGTVNRPIGDGVEALLLVET